MIDRFVSHRYPFIMLIDPDSGEIRFSPMDTRPAEQQWETAVRGDLLDEMLEEYKRLHGRLRFKS